MYFSNTPPIPVNQTRLNGSRRNLNTYNQTELDERLHELAEQQQSFQQPSPALSFRSIYNSPYGDNAAISQGFSRATPQLQHYYPGGPVGGYASNMALNRAPPRGPASEVSAADSGRSALLEEFRLSKGAKRYELKVGLRTSYADFD